MRALLTLMLLLPLTAAADGWILVPELVTGRVKSQLPGFEPPSIWVYDAEGKPWEKAPGPHKVGKRIAVPAGTWQLEVGTVRAVQNRVQVAVADGKTTVIPTGLVAISVEPSDEQPADVCPQWDSELYVYLPTDKEPGPMIAENRDARHPRVGAVQLVAGFYRVQWNRFWTTVEVKDGHLYHLETGLAGPMPADGYAVFHEQDTKSVGPNLKLCRSRPTRLLSRSYHGTYQRPTQKYPFRERVWEAITVQKPESRKGPYDKLRFPRARGPIHTGPEASPLMLWEVPAPAPPEPADEAPDEEEAEPQEDEAPKKSRTRGLPKPPQVTPIPSP